MFCNTFLSIFLLLGWRQNWIEILLQEQKFFWRSQPSSKEVSQVGIIRKTVPNDSCMLIFYANASSCAERPNLYKIMSNNFLHYSTISMTSFFLFG